MYLELVNEIKIECFLFYSTTSYLTLCYAMLNMLIYNVKFVFLIKHKFCNLLHLRNECQCTLLL